MDQKPMVTMQIDEARQFVDSLIESGIEIAVAGWVKEAESGDWYLYIGTPLVTEEGGKKPAYGRIHESIDELKSDLPWIVEIDIKVISPTSSIAQAMIAVRDRRPRRTPTYFQGRLGELEVEEAYILPAR